MLMITMHLLLLLFIMQLYSIQQRNVQFLINILILNFFIILYMFRSVGFNFRKTAVYKIMVRYVLHATV